MAVYGLAVMFQRRMSLEGHQILPFILLSLALMLLGSVDYARSKGLHPIFGVLAVVTLIGIVVLVVWPDSYEVTGASDSKKKRKR